MDIEETVEFILGVQARLEASVQKHDEQIATLGSSVATLTDLVGRLAQAEIRLTERMAAGFQELRELQANTEYKLNALIDTVDRLVRRNGHKE
jgi:hypothetical protein